MNYFFYFLYIVRESTWLLYKEFKKRSSGSFESSLWNGLAPIQVFNAVPSPPFSAAAELASLRHPRRPARPGSLEGQRRCEATSLGNPRGYAPLVAGRFKASEKGRQGATESERPLEGGMGSDSPSKVAQEG